MTHDEDTAAPLEQSLAAAAARFHGENLNEPAVRKDIAGELATLMEDAILDGKHAERDTAIGLLQELLAHAPEDAALRNRVAHALSVAVYQTKQREDHARMLALLSALEEANATQPLRGEERSQFIRAFEANFDYDTPQEGPPWRQDLIDVLRRLHAAHPDDASVRKWFAMAATHGPSDSDAAGRQACSDELQTLHEQFPEDAQVGAAFALYLSTSKPDASQKTDLSLKRLGNLQSVFPENTTIRGAYAGALVMRVLQREQSAIPHAVEALRQLHHTYPDDTEVTCPLVEALCSVLSRSEDSSLACGKLATLIAELTGLLNQLAGEQELRSPLPEILYAFAHTGTRILQAYPDLLEAFRAVQPSLHFISENRALDFERALASIGSDRFDSDAPS